MSKTVVQCPKCKALCVNHKTFTSIRVADYTNKRFERSYYCGPYTKGGTHNEHEWTVIDPRPGVEVIYSELGDERRENKPS